MKKRIILKKNNFLEYYIKPRLDTLLEKSKVRLISNIGLNKKNARQKRALFIYLDTAIPYYVINDLESCKILNSHALIWHAYEFVRCLVMRGYVVDFRSSYSESIKVDWEKYDLIVDERNNLLNLTNNKTTVRVFYATGLPFNFQNNSELERIEAFYKRTGLLTPPQRFAKPNLSDKVADHILYYGNEALMSMFDPKPQRHQLNISVTHELDLIFDEDCAEFMWLGSVGAIHKGLDLAVEAFKELPYKLHIFGNISKESIFFGWLNEQMVNYPNIIYHGYADLSSTHFQTIAKKCLANIFPSCSENGAGSVAQTSFLGIIPITTKYANTRSQHLGIVIDSIEENEIISEIRKSVLKLMALSKAEIQTMRNRLIQFSKTTHSKKAYSESVLSFLDKIDSEQFKGIA